MEVSPKGFRRISAVAGTAIVLAAMGSVAAPKLSGANGPTSPPNQIVLNDARHFPAPGSSGISRAPVIVRVGGGFDWVDAVAGVVAGVGVTLVGTGALREVRRRWPEARAGRFERIAREEES